MKPKNLLLDAWMHCVFVVKNEIYVLRHLIKYLGQAIILTFQTSHVRLPISVCVASSNHPAGRVRRIAAVATVWYNSADSERAGYCRRLSVGNSGKSCLAFCKQAQSIKHAFLSTYVIYPIWRCDIIQYIVYNINDLIVDWIKDNCS